VPNFIAYSMLILWPLLCLGVAAFLPLRRALGFSILGGFLLLPTLAIPMPLIPLNKYLSSILGALLLALVKAPRGLVARRWFSKIEVCFVVFAVGSVATVMTNRVPVIAGPRMLPGLTLRDSAEMSVFVFAYWYLPCMLGRRYFRDPQALVDLHVVILVGALAYLLPIAYELKMSPQLHRLVYGYHPSSFVQEVRGEGYRPMVFTGHGLLLTFFLAMSVISAFTLWRARVRLFGYRTGVFGALCFTFLVLCRSLGSLLYSVVSIPALLRLRPRAVLVLCMVLAGYVVLYPMLRSSNVLSSDSLISAAQPFGAERAESFAFRVVNEENLLERARPRIWFGWGNWGRARVYDAAGRDRSVTDGLWIILLGQSGVVGFGAVFGMLLVPIFVTWTRLRVVRSDADAILLAGTAWVVALAAFDSIPNATFSPSFFIAGALCGAAEGASRAARLAHPRRRTAPGRERRSSAEPTLPPVDAGAQPAPPPRKSLAAQLGWGTAAETSASAPPHGTQVPTPDDSQET